MYKLCCGMLRKGKLIISSVTPPTSNANPNIPLTPLWSSANANQRNPFVEQQLRATASSVSREVGERNWHALRDAMSTYNSTSSTSSAVDANSSRKKPKLLNYFEKRFPVVCVGGVFRIIARVAYVPSLLTSLQAGCGSE